MKPLLSTIVLALIAACAGQIPRPTRMQARIASQRWPGVTADALERGRSLYIVRCSGCHTLRLPSADPAERWLPILDKMQKRSKLADSEKEAILRYVLSVNENP